jgi:hypothetical protein
MADVWSNDPDRTTRRGDTGTSVYLAPNGCEMCGAIPGTHHKSTCIVAIERAFAGTFYHNR